MTIWASIGVVWLVVVAHAMIRWITSDTGFAPAPVLSPDVVPPWNLLALRTFEGLCVIAIVALVWFCVIQPWGRTGALGLDGRFVIAGCMPLHIPPRRRDSPRICCGRRAWTWTSARASLLALVFVAEFAFDLYV